MNLEAKLFDIELPMYGSIYYEGDLPASCRRVSVPTPSTESDRLCIGPNTAESWWFQKRQELDVDRGPCKANHDF